MTEVKKVGFMIYFMFTASQRLQHEENSQGGGSSLKQNKARGGQKSPAMPSYARREHHQNLYAHTNFGGDLRF